MVTDNSKEGIGLMATLSDLLCKYKNQ